jgi:low affinity Fe/Cu permease
MQLKLDELIKSQQKARNDLLGLEELTDEELDMLQEDFHTLRQEFIDRQAALIKHHVAKRHEKHKK